MAQQLCCLSMSMYEFTCDICRDVFEEYQPITQEAEHTASCPRCGKLGRRKYTPNGHTFAFKYGWDPGAGKYFDSARQRDNHLAEAGLEKQKSN